MKLAVIGTGYVGLVVGACFAETGNEVICVDRDKAKIRLLNRGKIPIFEPGLEELVRRYHTEKRLTFVTGLPDAVRRCDVIFIAVGTPQGEDGSADLQHVLDAAREIGRAMNGYKVIVDKSTVPAGTAAKVRDVIRKETRHPFSVVSNPEFLKQGAAVGDFLKPDRVVIGADDERSAKIITDLYSPFTRTGAPIMVMDTTSAELAKYAANAMLATRISFMNEMANVCEKFGADVDQVRRAIASDRRIGSAFLFSGVGYGGSCFPKDVKAMVKFARDKKYRFRVLEAVEQVNDLQKLRLLDRLDKQFGKSLKGRTIALWGLAFKPRTDDMREAPAIPIVEGILKRGGRVRAFDPAAKGVAQRIFGSRITYAKNAYDAVTGADALLVVTEWNEFREPDFAKVRKLMKQPILFDGRNIYNPKQLRDAGFTYLVHRPRMSTVLVTGGAGYVGSHAVKALAAAGADVVVYDDLSAGHAEAIDRLAHAFRARKISLARGDVLDTPRLTDTLRASGATAVMHFAARLLVGESVREPLQYYRANVGGALSVLEAMVATGVRSFVFSSTCATFGEPVAVPIDETHPQRPINAYGETKLAVERALPHIERAFGIRSVTLRYFNAAGADPDGLIGEDHHPEEHLIPLAIAAAQGGRPLTLFGSDYDTPDGTCVRDYIHVMDLADAHVASLQRLETGGASASLNLGTGTGMSVREVVDSVARVTGRNVPHSVGPRRPGDPARLVGANGRARQELGWTPRLGALDTIVETAWRWHERMPRGYAT